MKCWKWKSWGLSEFAGVLAGGKCLALGVFWSCVLVMLRACICLALFGLVEPAFGGWLAGLVIFLLAELSVRAGQDGTLHLFLLLRLHLLAATAGVAGLALGTVRGGPLLLLFLLNIRWPASLPLRLSNRCIFTLWVWRPSTLVSRGLGRCLFLRWFRASLLLLSRLLLALLSLLLFWFWLIQLSQIDADLLWLRLFQEFVSLFDGSIHGGWSVQLFLVAFSRLFWILVNKVVAFFYGVCHGLGSLDFLFAALCLVGSIDFLRLSLECWLFATLLGRAVLLLFCGFFTFGGRPVWLAGLVVGFADFDWFPGGVLGLGLVEESFGVAVLELLIVIGHFGDGRHEETAALLDGGLLCGPLHALLSALGHLNFN